MSEIKVNSIKGLAASQAAITIDNASGSATANLTTVNSVVMPNGGQFANKNLIINGDMRIAQRAVSASVSASNTGYTTLDRWRFQDHGSPTAVYGITRSTDAPDGFSNSLKLATSTADTAMAAGDATYIDYQIESQDLQHLQYGTSNAKSLTLSFHVRGTITGTYVVWFYSVDTAKAFTRTYTISTANTWEKKTITFTGDTATALGNDVETGLLIRWVLSVGTDYSNGTASTNWATASVTNANRYVGQTVNLAATTSDNWYLTGVMLEVGSVATDFEYRSVAQEEMLCRRYYQPAPTSSNTSKTRYGQRYSTGSGFVIVDHVPPMRATPALNWTARATSSGWAYANYSGKEITQVIMSALSPYITGLEMDAEL